MSQQLLHRQLRICPLLLRRQSMQTFAERQRPFSNVASIAGRGPALHYNSETPSSTYHHERINSPYSSVASVRWFSTDDDDGDDKKKKKKKDKKKDQQPVAAEETKEEVSKEESPKEEITQEEAEDKKPDEDDDCPNWQNPRLHNNPDNEKIFPEDFGPGEEMVFVEVPPVEDPNDPDKVLASQALYDLADEIVNLSMLEMKELTNKIGDHFEFEKPPFRGSGASGGEGADDDDEADAQPEEAAKTAFDLKLTGFDAKSKIKVIKEVRAIAGLGLKEAKEMVDGAPKVVMKDISKEAAEELQKKLEAVGATVEIV